MRFYVPVVLVIDAENENTAVEEADRVVSTLTSLGVIGLEGLCWIDDLNPSPASNDWMFNDKHLTNDCGTITVEEDREEE